MAQVNITKTTAANFIPEHWSNKTQDAVEFATVIKPRVNNDYEGDIKSMGDVVNITGSSNYTAVAKSVNTEIDIEALTHPTQQLVIDTCLYAAIRLEDWAEKQALPGYRDAQTKKLGYALARRMDVDLAGLFDGFSTNGTIGSAGVELSDSDYLLARQKLMEAGAIMQGQVESDCSIFLSPAAYVAALKIDKFVMYDDYGAPKDAVTKANIPMIYGIPVYVSNLLESDAAGQHDCAMIHRDALSIATQVTPHVESDRMLNWIADVIVAWDLYGVKELTRPGEGAANVTLSDNFGVYLATV
jgi:hypothetical protein